MIALLRSLFQAFNFNIYEGLIVLSVPLVFDLIPTIIQCIGITIHQIVRNIAYKLYLIKLKVKGATPGVTVIIAARNEENNIKKTIENVLDQNYPKLDLIIIDDGSTDKTYHIVKPFAKRGDLKLFQRKNTDGSKAAALNWGIRLAKHNIIVTIDADTELDRNAIHELVKLFYKKEVVAIAGNIGVSNKKNLLTKLQAYEYQLSLDLGRRWADLTRNIVVMPGSFSAYRKEALIKLGGFDRDTITEDFDTALKFHKMKGGRVIFSPWGFAWTKAPETIKEWNKQRARWSRGELEAIMKHKNIMRPSFGIAGLFGAPMMIFVDLVLLLIRIFYIYFVFVIYPIIENYPVEKSIMFFFKSLLFTFIIYCIIDFISIITALFITPHKKDLRYFIYLPFTIFIYRPYHALIRLRGFIEHFTRDRRLWK